MVAAAAVVVFVVVRTTFSWFALQLSVLHFDGRCYTVTVHYVSSFSMASILALPSRPYSCDASSAPKPEP